MPIFDAQERDGRLIVLGLKADEDVFQGEIGCVDSTGAVVAAKTGSGLTAIGRIETVDIGKVEIKKGVFLYQNASADALSNADIGKDCYISDTTTVCKTATGKSKAGKVFAVEDAGVWVDFR